MLSSEAILNKSPSSYMHRTYVRPNSTAIWRAMILTGFQQSQETGVSHAGTALKSKIQMDMISIQ